MKTINQIIATDDRRIIASAIMQLGAAYSRCVASDDCPNPLKPWARMGDQCFIYTSHRDAADQLEQLATKDDVNTFAL